VRGEVGSWRPKGCCIIDMCVLWWGFSFSFSFSFCGLHDSFTFRSLLSFSLFSFFSFDLRIKFALVFARLCGTRLGSIFIGFGI